MKGIVSSLIITLVAVAANDCPSDWTQDKLLVHEDCHKFYMCVYGVPVEQVCDQDLYFNINNGQCDWQSNVDCSDRNVPGQDTTTPAGCTSNATTTTENPCSVTTTTRRPTTPTTTTTTTTPKPIDPCNTEGTTTSKPPTPAPGFLPNGCPVNPQVHWLLPVKGDCNAFYYCISGELVLSNCPDNLHFNTRIQDCDWPANAGCATSANKHSMAQYQ